MLRRMTVQEAAGLRLEDGDDVDGFHEIAVSLLLLGSQRSQIRLPPGDFDFSPQFVVRAQSSETPRQFRRESLSHRFQKSIEVCGCAHGSSIPHAAGVQATDSRVTVRMTR